MITTVGQDGSIGSSRNRKLQTTTTTTTTTTKCRAKKHKFFFVAILGFALQLFLFFKLFTTADMNLLPGIITSEQFSIGSHTAGLQTIPIPSFDDNYRVLEYLNTKSRLEIGYEGFLDILQRKKPSFDSTPDSNKSDRGRVVVAYSAPTSINATAGKNGMYLKNFHYFLDHAIDCDKHSTVIIATDAVIKEYGSRIMTMNDEHCRNSQYSIEFLERLDKCYDMESITAFLSKYDYFLYVHCSMVGPKTTGKMYWTDIFTSKFSETVKMIGVSINLSFYPHVQSMTFAVDRKGIEIIKKSTAVYDCGVNNNRGMTLEQVMRIVQGDEIGMSRAIMDAGYSIRSLTGALGNPITINKNDIETILRKAQDYFPHAPVIPSSEKNVWDSNAATFVLPWGDDIWNARTIRTIGNEKLPLWSDFVFFKVSRGYLLPEINDEVGYDINTSVEVYENFDLSLSNLHDEPVEDICKKALFNFRDASKLFTIVTGFQHSGTTILAQLIKSAPDVFGGFECGLLRNGTTPADFKNVEPFYDWMVWSTKEDLWGLSRESRDLLVSAKCDAEMYATLRDRSPLFHYSPNQNSYLVDKTPAYLLKLVDVMDRTPGIPVVIAQKNHEALIKTYKKRNFSDQRIEGEMRLRKKPLEAALKKYPDRIHIANTTRWYEDPDEVMEGVFNFLGLEWRSEYLTMAALNAKRVSGSVMSKAFDTKKGTSKEVSSLFA